MAKAAAYAELRFRVSTRISFPSGQALVCAVAVAQSREQRERVGAFAGAALGPAGRRLGARGFR